MGSWVLLLQPSATDSIKMLLDAESAIATAVMMNVETTNSLALHQSIHGKIETLNPQAPPIAKQQIDGVIRLFLGLGKIRSDRQEYRLAKDGSITPSLTREYDETAFDLLVCLVAKHLAGPLDRSTLSEITNEIYYSENGEGGS